MSKLTFASLAMCCVFSTISVAADSIGDKFKQLDRNEDGFLSRSESARDPALWSRFSNYDNNKDNKLSLSEYKAYASK
ncbi:MULTISPECIES: EF-hand domain-containing protein [Pseudoalteromonas]|jgi:hypothetical protein|uniref:EF-hand domain-containing protein n=1 Tax=Pseudoalteromonas TaxID=53246 RepID=UPI000C3B482B|nr:MULTISPECIES: EF-hand domain-containing protein [unclassified Pseudoalteromonas]MBD58131.1 calcium-binding protein [Pseudoalteromonas sp.]TMO42337.1 calcium-binding protein [Pseudoalteromonas sp. S4389]HCV03184.1 calcium-binding protein [Pseudoalteromonas sp.]|tara:strand:- start:238 stop:471 length:234 start_codon:yes stop_codon:yes gene_type:complete